MVQHDIDLTVFQMRTWFPGRPMLQHDTYEGVRVVRYAVPQIPSKPHRFPKPTVYLNMLLAYHFGKWLIGDLLRETDLLHSVGIFPLGIIANRWAQSLGKPHVTQAIGTDLNVGLSQRHDMRIVRCWINGLSGVIGNSQALVDRFVSMYPQIEPVQVIYRGVDLAEFTPDNPPLGALATRPPVRFLFLGGFPRGHSAGDQATNAKGGLTVMRAWSAAEDRLIRADASLLIAGVNSDHAAMSAWRQTLQQPERVHLMGRLPAPEIPGYMRAADVVLCPSLAEGLPNVAMEAAASGCAVAGSDVGGIPETIIHGQTGLILQPDDLPAWSAALTDLADEPSRVAAMGRAGRQLMQSRFDSGNYAPALIKFYQRVLINVIRKA
ncbi:MAG: glycosyltransferase [Anaerolineaceae bacterium]|nr:MAG: glycosyltransferase [Anaerolineaceae bacterium]